MARMKKIELQEAVAALRAELAHSIKASQGEEIKFMVQEITMEFLLEVELSAEAKGGVKFLLQEFGAGGAAKRKDAHKIVISLKPVGPGNKSVMTMAKETPE